MIAFNLIGLGFLDIGDPSGISFKRSNAMYRFADVSLARTTEFTVPATGANLSLLDFPDDPVMDGVTMRRTYECEMLHDGGVELGLIEVRKREGGDLACVYYPGMTKELEGVLGRKVSDCASTMPSVTLREASVVTSELADPSAKAQLISYDDGVNLWSKSALHPSVNAWKFAEDILTGLGLTASLHIPSQLWMVSPTIYGGSSDRIAIEQTSTNSVTVQSTQSQNYLSVVPITLHSADACVLGVYVGGADTPSYGFRVNKDVTLTFPSDFPASVFMVADADSVSRYVTLGGVNASGQGDPHGVGTWHDGSASLRGRSVQLKRGTTFFFASRRWLGVRPTYGYDDIAYPLSFSVDASGETTSVADGDEWRVQDNMPDMTVFEMLKGLALATGTEIIVRSFPSGTLVEMCPPSVSMSDFTEVPLGDAVEVVGVTRSVQCWGEGVREVTVGFSSEDYVTSPVESSYCIDSDQLTDGAEFRSCFNEGAVSTFLDGYGTGTPYTLILSDKAFKRWSLGVGGVNGDRYLRRLSPPSYAMYDSIAQQACCLRLRTAMPVSDFLAMSDWSAFTWRGGCFVWTDATWTDGIATLTLQKFN